MKLHTLSLLALTSCGSAVASQNSKTSQSVTSVTPATIAVNSPETVTVAPTPIPTATSLNVTDNNITIADNSNSNVTVNPNGTNSNTYSKNPVTGLLDFRFGSFVVGGSGKTDSRNYDGCQVLTGTTDATHPGYLHGSFIFQYSSDIPNVFLANGALTISGTGDPTYSQNTIITSTTLYPDGTGTMTWYRPATPTVPSCYTFYASVTVDVSP